MSHQVTVSDDTLEQVDAVIEARTGLPVDDVDADAKLQCLVAGFRGETEPVGSVPDDVRVTLQEHERTLVDLINAVENLSDAVGGDVDGAVDGAVEDERRQQTRAADGGAADVDDGSDEW